MSSARTIRCEPLEPRQFLNAGDLDTSFSGDGRATITVARDVTLSAADVAVQSDGKIVVAGTYAEPTLNFFGVARFNVDGTLDTTFGGGDGISAAIFLGKTNVEAAATAIQADGKIVVVGYADNNMAIQRFDSTGALDPTFSSDGRDLITDFDGLNLSQASELAIQNDGKIVVVGTCFTVDGTEDVAVARYNTDGTLDNSFDGNGTRRIDFGQADAARAIAIDSSGRLVIAGTTAGPGDPSLNRQFAIARLNANGSLDGSFSGDGKVVAPFVGEYAYSDARGVVIQPNGKIVIAGEVGNLNPSHNLGLFRLNSDGTGDPNFGVGNGQIEVDYGGWDTVSDLIIGQSGQLFACGGTSTGAMSVTCLTSEGSLDVVFSGDGKQTFTFDGMPVAAHALARAPGGTIVAAGGDKFATARFFDRKPAGVSIGSFDPYAGETGPNTATLTFGRVERLATPTRIYLNISGTASSRLPGRDYTGSAEIHLPIFAGDPSYIDIPANATFVSATLTPIDDSAVEGDEFATFAIAPDAAYDIGTPPSTTIVIHDNDIGSGPAVTSSQFIYDEPLPQRVAVSFNQDVSASIAATDFAVYGPSGNVPFSFSHNDVTDTSTLSFSGILPDGNYVAYAAAGTITNSSGTPMATDFVYDFFFLAADANHDRTVDTLDFNAFAANFGKSDVTYSKGDFNYDNLVDTLDFNTLASHFGKSVPPSAPAAISTAAAPAPGTAVFSSLRIRQMDLIGDELGGLIL